MRKKIVAGNWKMNTLPAEGVELAKSVVAGRGEVCECVNFIVCPPFTHLSQVIEAVKGSEFVVFKSAIENGGSVRCIVAKNAASVLTRKEIDKLTEHAKGIGAKGLAYIRWADEPNCSFKKFLGEGDLEKICAAVPTCKVRVYDIEDKAVFVIIAVLI